jgi:hypothetical protein
VVVQVQEQIKRPQIQVDQVQVVQVLSTLAQLQAVLEQLIKDLLVELVLKAREPMVQLVAEVARVQLVPILQIRAQVATEDRALHRQ